jgi:hypothetical protein
MITDSSFQVRLVNITYVDTGGKEDPFTRLGFLIEDEDHLAKRMGGIIVERELVSQDLCYQPILDKLVVYQYFIGNTDWWVPNLHNLKLVSGESGIRPVSIPYDFDYAGVINTSYSTPHESLPIKSVRERYFRGYCRMKGTYEKILEQFIILKPEIYNLYQKSPYLNDKKKKSILKYYDAFYKIIENPNAVKTIFYDKCPLKHKHLHQQ